MVIAQCPIGSDHYIISPFLKYKESITEPFWGRIEKKKERRSHGSTLQFFLHSALM